MSEEGIRGLREEAPWLGKAFGDREGRDGVLFRWAGAGKQYKKVEPPSRARAGTHSSSQSGLLRFLWDQMEVSA